MVAGFLLRFTHERATLFQTVSNAREEAWPPPERLWLLTSEEVAFTEPLGVMQILGDHELAPFADIIMEEQLADGVEITPFYRLSYSKLGSDVEEMAHVMRGAEFQLEKPADFVEPS